MPSLADLFYECLDCSLPLNYPTDLLACLSLSLSPSLMSPSLVSRSLMSPSLMSRSLHDPDKQADLCAAHNLLAPDSDWLAPPDVTDYGSRFDPDTDASESDLDTQYMTLMGPGVPVGPER